MPVSVVCAPPPAGGGYNIMLTKISITSTQSYNNIIMLTIISTLCAGFIVSVTQATVGGSPFGPFISVARGHSRE